jgi:hypothetical protein
MLQSRLTVLADRPSCSAISANVCIAIADVSGKGVSAAIVAAILLPTDGLTEAEDSNGLMFGSRGWSPARLTRMSTRSLRKF